MQEAFANTRCKCMSTQSKRTSAGNHAKPKYCLSENFNQTNYIQLHLNVIFCGMFHLVYRNLVSPSSLKREHRAYRKYVYVNVLCTRAEYITRNRRELKKSGSSSLGSSRRAGLSALSFHRYNVRFWIWDGSALAKRTRACDRHHYVRPLLEIDKFIQSYY